MSEDQAQYAVQKKQPIEIDLSKGVMPQNYGELLQFAKLYQESGLAPKSFQSVPQVAIAIGMCLELGRPILTGLQDMAVINGKVAIYGDAALAQVRSSGQLEYIKETEEGKPYTDDWAFRCEIKRKGTPQPHVGTWTWEDSKRAGFDKPKTKDGRDDIWSPWVRFTRRMMQFKARNFVMRDEFGDVLKGLPTAEEVQDYIDVTPEKPKTNGLHEIPKTEGQGNGATYDFKKEKPEPANEAPPAGAPGPKVERKEEAGPRMNGTNSEPPRKEPENKVQEGGPPVENTANRPPIEVAEILSAIKLASKVKGKRGKEGIQFLYEKNPKKILSLTGTNLGYAKAVYETVGFDWDEFVKGPAQNQAQDQRSHENEGNGTTQGEDAKGDGEQEAGGTQSSPETTKDYDFLGAMGEMKERIGSDVYYIILGNHGYTKANEITKREEQEKLYRAMKAEWLEQQEIDKQLGTEEGQHGND